MILYRLPCIWDDTESHPSLSSSTKRHFYFMYMISHVQALRIFQSASWLIIMRIVFDCETSMFLADHPSVHPLTVRTPAPPTRVKYNKSTSSCQNVFSDLLRSYFLNKDTKHCETRSCQLHDSISQHFNSMNHKRPASVRSYFVWGRFQLTFTRKTTEVTVYQSLYDADKVVGSRQWLNKGHIIRLTLVKGSVHVDVWIQLMLQCSYVLIVTNSWIIFASLQPGIELINKEITAQVFF